MLNFFYVFKGKQIVNSVVNLNSPSISNQLSYAFKTDWILFQVINLLSYLLMERQV